MKMKLLLDESFMKFNCFATGMKLKSQIIFNFKNIIFFIVIIVLEDISYKFTPFHFVF